MASARGPGRRAFEDSSARSRENHMKHTGHSARGIAVAGFAFTTLLASGAGAQTVDYQRAERFLNWNTSDLIAGDQVNPNWMPDGNRFWYRNKTGGGSEFIMVDPVRNAKAPVFDHARLAAAMSLAADTAYVGYKLPFQSFEFVDGERAIEFDAAKKRFKCDITTYQCTLGDTLANKQAYVASPDSAWEVFYKDYNLWIRPFGGGDSTQLTTDGEKFWSYGVTEPRPQQLLQNRREPPRPDVRWSPDSKKIAVSRRDERNVEHMHYISYTSQRPRHFSQPYALPGDSIVPVPNVHIIDVTTKTNVPLKIFPIPNQLQFGGSPIDSAWTKDSQKFRFHYLTRASKSMYLAEGDAQTGQIRILAKDTARTWVETNPQGRPSWTVTSDGADVIWWSERDGWPHLWRLDGRAGINTTVATEAGDDGDGVPGLRVNSVGTTAVKNQITSGAWAVGDVLYVDEAKKQIYFTGRGREDDRLIYYAHLYRVNFDGSGLTLLTPEDANHDIRVSPSGRYIVDTYSRFDKAPVTVLRTIDGRVIRTLEEADISRLEAIGWKPPVVFNVKARDNVTDLYGIMWLPPNLDPNRKYPVIEYIYPGPQVGSVGQWRFQTGNENRALAELGFVVVQLDHLGTPLRSKAFHDNYYGNFGDNGLPDHIFGLKQLGARYPFMDLDRVGIYGHSGGGFASTDAILRYPEFYKVAVSGAGNHDNRSYNIYWAEKYQGLMVKDTLRKTDNFEGSANKTMAKNLQGKLLLQHGDMDDNVHPAMTIQVVDELIKANKDFDLVIAPNRGHGLNEPYFIRRRWDYFVRHLMGAEPPKEYQITRPEGSGGGPGGGPQP
jgi:dipeptidyl aminopeptidase/acylaminoacyl peptidase